MNQDLQNKEAYSHPHATMHKLHSNTPYSHQLIPKSCLNSNRSQGRIHCFSKRYKEGSRSFKEFVSNISFIVKDKDTEKANSHLLNHPLNGHANTRSQDLSLPHGLQKPQYLTHHPLLPRLSISRKRNRTQSCSLSCREVGTLTSFLSTSPNAHPGKKIIICCCFREITSLLHFVYSHEH